MRKELADKLRKQPSSTGLVSKRNALLLAQNNRNFTAQLYAIKGALQRNMEAELRVLEEFNRLQEQQDKLDPEEDDYWNYFDYQKDNIIKETVYFDAAHSMAAVGMLAPYFESLFTSIFETLGRQGQAEKKEGSRERFSQETYWNPKYVLSASGAKEDLVEGIIQLAKDVDLLRYLPPDLAKTLKALFAYRNNMFHNGFEWPMTTRQKFQSRIDNNHWPADWFEKSTTSKGPWIFYMSDGFILHCLTTIDQVFEGLDKFLVGERQ